MFRRDFCKFGLAGIGAFALSNSVNALGYLAAATKKKYAIIYYSWCGSTKDAADWINEGMGGVADVLDEKNSQL